MNLLIVPKPLFTSEMQVEGYIFSAQYGNAILESAKPNPLDRAMSSPFIEFLNVVGLEALTQGKQVFVPVTKIQLATELDDTITQDSSKVVLTIDARTVADEATLARLEKFSKLGYKIAVYYSGKTESVLSFMPYVNYVLIKVPSDKILAHASALKREFPSVTLIALDVPEKADFDSITFSKDNKVNLFDGAFYKVHKPSSTRQNALSPLKTNYLQLLNIVNQDDFDFQTFTRTVRQDTALAIQFMKLVNNASKSRSEIKNLNQAAAMLGQKEIKKWVSTAVSNALCEDSPSEITRLSLIRAKFCENLARLFEMAVHQENLFIMGLFSVLDVVLEMPLEEAFKIVFVPKQISDALVNQMGEFYSVLYFVLQYEFAHWKEISRIALVRNISIDQIHFAYKEALLWYSDLINMTFDESAI